jgi:hypothetical protein
VVLVGDGHYDPKNYSGYGRVSYMPPYLAFADPWIGETAADNRYVTVVGGDTFPDLMLGRLAVNSSAEASAFVNKIVAYEQSPVWGDWRRQVLAVADNADSGGDFALMSNNLLADYLPAAYQATKVHYGVTHTTAASARAAILAGINAGKLIVNYIGHGAATAWADEGLFEAPDVAGLTNGGKLPVVLAMTCYDGYYQYPYPTAVELLWLDATGQAGYIELGWETASEVDNLGFNLCRAIQTDGPMTKINAELIPSLVAPGSSDGAVYSFRDRGAKRDRTYYYWLEVADIYGHAELQGPLSARRVK